MLVKTEKESWRALLEDKQPTNYWTRVTAHLDVAGIVRRSRPLDGSHVSLRRSLTNYYSRLVKVIGMRRK